ncbi:hypothetical protein ACI65C_005266 [Semiaphis heraclei]
MGKTITDLYNGFETIKVLMTTALENGTIAFDRWSDQMHQLVLETWNNSSSIQNIHEVIHLGWEQVIEAWLQTKCSLQRYDLNVLVDALQSKIIYLTGNSFNRSHVYIGFAGLFVGSGVGFLIGISIKPSAITVTHMKAASATSYNGTESITLLEDVVTPKITESNQVMIMVRAAAIDPMDILVASGYGSFIRKFLIKHTLNKSMHREFPIVLGRDCSGVVIDLGSEVRRDININDEVWVSLPPWSPCGTLCETIVVPDTYVGHKPRSLTHEQAATLPFSGSLAWLAVFQTANLNPLTAVDKKIIIYCGDTGTGSIIVQLCCYLKADVTVACPSRVCHFMKYLGATTTYETETVSIDQLLSTAPNGYDYVFNTAGELKNSLCKQLCNVCGIVVPIGPHHLPSDSFGLVRGFFYVQWLRLAFLFKGNKCWDHYEFNSTILNELASMANDYVLRPVLDKTFMEHELERAFKHLQSRQTIGKVVMKFSNLSCPTLMPRSSGILF